MKILNYTDIPGTKFETDAVKGVTGRVVIGKDDGASNFCMRIFEVAEGGFSPRHTHEWEHEILIHSGKGEVFSGGNWIPVKAGTAIYIPGNEEHQLKNSGPETLVFACLIPAGAPEL